MSDLTWIGQALEKKLISRDDDERRADPSGGRDLIRRAGANIEEETNV